LVEKVGVAKLRKGSIRPVRRSSGPFGGNVAYRNEVQRQQLARRRFKAPAVDQIGQAELGAIAAALVQGSAMVRCTVNTSHMYDECHVLSEDPPGYDFGLYAIQLAMREMRAAGAPPPAPGQTVDLPFRFERPN